MKLPVVVLLAVGAGASYAQELESAKVLGAETRGTENVLAVQIGDIAVVASYVARWSIMGNTREGKRASDLVIGSTIQARIDGSKLVFVMPDGGTMKADIVRRQLVTADTPFVLPDVASTSQPSSDARRRMEERQRCFQRQQTEHGLGGPVPNAALCQ